MKKGILTLIGFLYFMRLDAQTANWSAVLPNQFPTNVSGQIHGISRVSQMKFHPTNSQKRYAVSARGGLFITTNSGNNWALAPGCDFMPYARFASVCIDHTNDQIIYLGTGDNDYYYNGLGVWKSTNGGVTFSQTGLTNKLVVDMLMDPLDNQQIVAITQTGIYKTNNAGTSWSLKSASRPFKQILQKATGSRTLYAATADSAFFRSADFGETWTQITTGIVMPSGITNGDGCRIAVSPADTNVVYFAMVANGGMLYKSTNGGTSFSAMKTTASPYLTYYSNSSASSGQGDYNFAIGADRLNANIVYMVAHNNWKSTNGGTTWTQLTNWWEKCHTDMHQIETSPYNNNELYNMNDGGVFVSTDGGNNWTPKSDGMYGYEIYHGNCSPTRRDMISIGTQDNGELYSTTTGWFTNRGGDWGSQCAFDYRPNSNVVYYYGNNQRRSVTGGDVTYGLPARVADLDEIAFHRSNTNLAFVADSFIYRTTNLLNTTPAWTQIAALGKIIKAMHVAYSDPNRLYIITNDGQIHVSANALSATPTFTSYALPNSTNNQASITTIKNAPGTVYVTCNTKVYRSTNFGATWSNITYNLPSFNHIKIIADEFFPLNEVVLLATGSAVYFKTQNATTWTLYNQNLPTRPEGIDLSIYNDSTANTVLRMATYGRGMWETPISNLRQLNAAFAASSQTPCVGNAVQFYDNSLGAVTSWNWSFPGGTPSSSTAQNPVVTYNSPGTYSVSLTVSTGSSNSSVTQSNYITTFGAGLPFSEGFEGVETPPLGWQNIDLGTGGIAWAESSNAGGYGNSASSMMFDNYSWNYPGEKDELISKKISLSGISAAKLYFDVAYQVFSGYSDSLAVFISTDCGTTFTKVYQKGGSVLSTAGSGGNNFVPTAAQWRTDTVSLNAYAGQQILIKFQNINGYGNKLYLDNVNVQSAPTASFTASPTSGCAGTVVSFTNSTTGNATSYSWSFPGGTPSSSTLANPTVTYATGGNYSVTLTANNFIGSNTNTQNNLIQITPNTSNTTVASACASYTWSVNNQTYTQSGTYTNTVGCHTEILNLTITPNTSNTTTASACGSYTWSVNNQTYTQSGTYTNTVGCHTEVLNLSITPNTSNTTVASACGSYTWSVNNQTYTQSGTYTNTVGCHTEVLNLSITPNTSNTTTASACGSYTWSVNNQTYTQSGTYTYTVGCHTEILNLSITPNTSNTTTASACGSYTWSVNNQTYTQSGTYTNTVGCHTEVLNLSITPNTSNTTLASACASYTWSVNNQIYTQSGTYTNTVGCHTEILNLSITPNTSNTTIASACGSYTWSVNNQTYTQSGTYTNTVGCHTEVLNLSITPNTSNTTLASACGSYTWSVNNQTYTQSGTYTNTVGCHTEVLNLSITPNTSNTTTASACGSYTWSVNNQTYTQSGTYTNTVGCHTEVLNLSITPNTSNTTVASACGSYTWSVNNQTYMQSGTYTNTVGCHTEILNLTITPNTSNTTVASACASYTWSVNNQTYTQSGTYTNTVGCHTEVLNLSITPNTSNTTTASACGSYTWSVNNQTYTQSGTYTNTVGCHTEVLNLSITPNTSNTTVASACGSYTWSVNNQTYMQSGTYTNTVGCHTEILILTMAVNQTFTTTASDCQSYYWSVNGQTYTQSGTYTYNVGCNQYLLNLTIHGLPVVTAFNVSACTGSSVTLTATPSGGVFSVANPYTGPSTNFTYTYTDGNGCTVTSSPASITMQNALPVTGIFVNNIGANTATVNWNTIPGLQWYEIRYRVVGSSTWTGGGTQAAPTTTKNIVGLTNASDYEIEVRGFCSSGYPGPWSTTYIFSTDNSCTSPQNLISTNVTSTSAQLNWTAQSNVLYYQTRYRVQGGGSWTNGTSNTNSKVISGLQSSTTYDWQVRAVCLPSPYSTSSWSIPADLMTTSLKPEKSSTTQEEDIRIYPNPSSDELVVLVPEKYMQFECLRIYDLSGRLIREIQYPHQKTSEAFRLDLRRLNPGSYLLYVCSEAHSLKPIQFTKQ